MLAAALASGLTAEAQQSEVKQAFADAELTVATESADKQVIFDPAVEPVGCNTCDPCSSGGGLGLASMGRGGRRGQFFVGAEYLSLRANFSEATAYRANTPAPPDGPAEDFVQFDFDYGDSYRLYGGYRLCDCGGEIRFTYSNFDSNGSFNSGPQPAGTTFTAPYEVVTSGTDDVLFGDARVTLDDYDIGFSKTIPLGGWCCDTGCGDTACGDGCCDPCGSCCGCPPWDLVWTGAIRISSVDSELNYASNIAPANNGGGTIPNRGAQSTVSFDGVGLRTGLLGRRYIGKRGIFSAYVRGDISLLLGDVETVTRSTAGPTIATTTLTSTQVVPVTEIEAGLTAFLTQRVAVTGGYLLSAWHDLGHRTEYDFGPTGSQILSMDDANLMTWDGFFLRAEAFF